MKRENLSSYTPAKCESNYPPYISVNFENNTVELTVRSEGSDTGQGAAAMIRLSWYQFWETMSDAAMHFEIMRGQSNYPIVMPSFAMKKRMQDLKAEHDKREGME